MMLKTVKYQKLLMMAIKIIISGGGTGGHIFPAISIANAIKEKVSDAEILFVGAEGRMEMERVPAAGYRIIGLPVSGFIRRLTFKNIAVLIKLWKSLRLASKIIDNFKPNAVVGVGGYASGPLVKRAVSKGIPALLQEQNSYAGVTNKLLAKKVQKICVAYPDMERYFPAKKIVFTGNPVRQNLLKPSSVDDAARLFNLEAGKKTVLILGGSLGARTLNECFLQNYEKMIQSDIQFIWQTGKLYIENIQKVIKGRESKHIFVSDFIADMNLAYSIADVVVSRAGAGTISELCLLAKPVVLVPSPNVAEDHQTKNAMALVNAGAAIMVSDSQVRDSLFDIVTDLVHDEDKKEILKNNIVKMGVQNSASLIADEVLNLIR
jgi:UDP-N-acetylglucosamine--N-acetylmuramyl-(pentapeptide) pyrophosphoryl-undecaprenol N-acetylglucosamine transferase